MGRVGRHRAAVAVVVVLAGAGVVLTDLEPASAAATVAATGQVSCTQAVGLVRFDPAVTLVGGPVAADVEVVFRGCNAGGGSNVTTSNFKGKARGSFVASGGTNCASLVGGSPAFSMSGSLDVVWTGRIRRNAGVSPYRLTPSTITFTQLVSTGTGANGDIGFTFAHQAMTGSFAGTVSGEVDSSTAWTRVVCGGSHTVSKLRLHAGTLNEP